MARRLAAALTLTLAGYGFVSWVYVAAIALVHPVTLNKPLTHFFSLPREDTFGALSFLVSAVSFCSYRMLTHRPRDGRAGPDEAPER
jgi:hypothetical protein